MFWSLDFFKPLHSSCTFAAAYNIAVISSNQAWLAFTYLTLASIQSNSDTILWCLSKSKYSPICKHEKGPSKHEQGISEWNHTKL